MLLHSDLFNCKNKDTYPPFKEGLYLEEYCVKRYLEDDNRQKNVNVRIFQ